MNAEEKWFGQAVAVIVLSAARVHAHENEDIKDVFKANLHNVNHNQPYVLYPE